eukprot:615934-Pelagomonas_calceolata.AAC.1
MPRISTLPGISILPLKLFCCVWCSGCCRQLPPEERTMTIPEGEEKEVSCLMDGLKEHFKSTGTLSDAAKEAHKQVCKDGEHRASSKPLQTALRKSTAFSKGVVQKFRLQVLAGLRGPSRVQVVVFLPYSLFYPGVSRIGHPAAPPNSVI